jgi:hypothetical protein
MSINNVQCTDLLSVLLTGHPVKYWRDRFNVTTDPQLRTCWGAPHLTRILVVETLAQAKIDNEGMEPTQAIKEAIEALHYEVWDEDKLLGKGDRKTYLRNKQREHRTKTRAS